MQTSGENHFQFKIGGTCEMLGLKLSNWFIFMDVRYIQILKIKCNIVSNYGTSLFATRTNGKVGSHLTSDCKLISDKKEALLDKLPIKETVF